MTRRPCDELGTCQIEAAAMLARPLPPPCARCLYQEATPDSSAANRFPFAPGVIESHRRRRGRARLAIDAALTLAIVSLALWCIWAAVGLLWN
jgi:hypothetical protein